MRSGARLTGERAQSAVVGLVLLIGIVAVGSMGILVFGLEATDQTADRVEDEQIQRAFVTLDKRIDTVAREDRGSREVELGLNAENEALRKESTGRIVVRTTESDTEILNTTIGSIEYTSDETTYAYQGGGVWRGTGGDAQMISSPDIIYQDASLSLPLTVLSGDQTLQADPVRIKKSETPKFTEYDLVEGEVLVVEITSEYYAGWAQYFREEVDNAGVTVDAANETVIVELGQFTPPSGAFDEGVTATGDIQIDNGNPAINGDVTTTGDVNGTVNGDVTEGSEDSYAPIDRIIERKIENAEENGSVIEVDPDVDISTLEGGKVYYAPNGIDLDGDTVTADLATGNVTLIVDGDVHMESGTLEVINPSDDVALRTYASGNFSMKNSEFCVAPCGSSESLDSEHNQVYGTSEMQVGLRGGNSNYFEGSVYAPRREEVNGTNGAWQRVGGPDNKCDKPTGNDDYDVCLATGSSGFEGSIVAGSTRLSQNAEIDHDGGLEGMKPVYADSNTALPPPVTYFTITVYEVEVSDGDDDN
jgi:hypothetical protein